MILMLGWPFNEIADFFIDFLADIITGFFEGLASMLETAFSSSAGIYNLDEFVAARTYSKIIGLAIVSIILLKHFVDTYVLETDGDADASPIIAIERCAKIILIIAATDIICAEVLKWADMFVGGIVGSVAVNGDVGFLGTLVGELTLAITSFLVNPTIGIWTVLIFIIIYGVFFVILLIKAVLRGIEFGLMSILLPIMACDGVTVRQERWNAFFSSFIVTAFGYGIQLFLFKLSLVLAVDITTLLLSIGAIYFAVITPKWLEKFAYSSGLGNTARSGMYMAMMGGRMKGVFVKG